MSTDPKLIPADLHDLLDHKWRCPSCGFIADFFELLFPVDCSRELGCLRCEAEGMEEVDVQLKLIIGGKPSDAGDRP